MVIAAGGISASRWVAIVSLFRLVRMSRLVSIATIVLLDAIQVRPSTGAAILCPA